MFEFDCAEYFWQVRWASNGMWQMWDDETDLPESPTVAHALAWRDWRNGDWMQEGEPQRCRLVRADGYVCEYL